MGRKYDELEARVLALEAALARLQRHHHNTSPSADVTGGPCYRMEKTP